LDFTGSESRLRRARSCWRPTARCSDWAPRGRFGVRWPAWPGPRRSPPSPLWVL